MEALLPSDFSFKDPIEDRSVPLLSHNGHFRFGYNGKYFTRRSSESDVWQVGYGLPAVPAMSFYEACLYTARCVNADADRAVGILFSGGIDSEAVVRSFMDAGLPFRAFILRFANGYNLHDIEYAETFCRQQGINPCFLDLDVIDFFKSGMGDEYAELSDSVSPQFLVTMWAIDQIDEYSVIGNGDSDIVRRDSWSKIYKAHQYKIAPLDDKEETTGWDIWEKEKVASWYRHLLFRNRSGCAGFFQYTPEIISAAVNDPLMLNAYADSSSGIYSKGQLKQAFYQNHFPHKSRRKFDGFEKLRDLDAEQRNRYSKARPGANCVFRTDVSTFLSGSEQ